MVEVDAGLALTGPRGPLTLLEAFEGRRQLIAYYFMWWDGHPAAEQCEGCTWVTTQVTDLSYLHSDGGPPAWPPVPAWPGGRPIAQWPRLQAGRSDDLTCRRVSPRAGGR
jgi:Bacterial protein of unknown function (DUF899)